MTKYTVTNVYGIRGESNHRTPEAACRAAAKREGEGWVVVDAAGDQWDMGRYEDTASNVGPARMRCR